MDLSICIFQLKVLIMEVVVFIIFVDPFDKKNKDIYLDEDIREFFFGEGIKKSFWKHLKESVILEPSTTKIKFLIHSRRIFGSRKSASHNKLCN